MWGDPLGEMFYEAALDAVHLAKRRAKKQEAELDAYLKENRVTPAVQLTEAEPLEEAEPV